MNKFYLTTAIPYVNAKPHIGHALEFVQADVIARFHKLRGDETLLLSGGDENALKNLQAAEEENTPIQEFVDRNSQLFLELAKRLNVNFDVFQKGSDKKHHLSSQELWQLCFTEGDIYKKEYKGLYCVGCELFYERNELDKNGECLEHPSKKLEEVSEVNYFFKLSKYQKQIEELLTSNELKIIPESRKNEALSFLKRGLKDISISRSNKRAKNWGVDVPGDPSQKIYVWFDALNIYRSGLGEKYDEFWPADLHVIGKGILRFHAIYWPAFLLSAKIPLPKSIFVHGYFTVNGQKISKTLGNTIDPLDIIEKYGVDALRYYLLREIPPTQDGDFSEKRFKEVYNADLANGLGNLVSRVAKLCEQKNFNLNLLKQKRNNRLLEEVEGLVSKFRFNDALELIWGKIRGLDVYINRERPWQLQLTEANKKLSDIVIGSESTTSIEEIAEALSIFLPETAEKIQEQFKGPKIISQKPLFPRIN